jgi:hypothetical protein
VRGFALRLPTGNFFDLAVLPSKGNTSGLVIWLKGQHPTAFSASDGSNPKPETFRVPLILFFPGFQF